MSNLEEQLRALACKYEKKEFLDGDPSWFMHQVEGDLRTRRTRSVGTK